MLPQLSDIGKETIKTIEYIEKIYSKARVDKYIIMPNHVHMTIMITSADGSTLCSPTIPRIIKQCKEYVTKQIRYSIWQCSFHDHIIRNEDDYLTHWKYIDENPAKWSLDEYYTPDSK